MTPAAAAHRPVVRRLPASSRAEKRDGDAHERRRRGHGIAHVMPRIGADRGAADVRRHRTHPPRQDRLRHDDEHQNSERPRCRRVMQHADLGDRLDGDAEAGAHQHRRHHGGSQRLSLPVAERVMLASIADRMLSPPRRSAKRRCRPWIRRHPPPARSCCQTGDQLGQRERRVGEDAELRRADTAMRGQGLPIAHAYRASAGPAPFSASSRCLSRVLVG